VHPQCLCVRAGSAELSGPPQLWVGLSDGGLQVWDAEGRTRLSTPKGHAAAVLALAAVGGSQVWSGDESGQLLVWNAAALKKTSPLRKLKLNASCAALLPLRADDHRSVWAVSGDSSLSVLEAESTRVLHQLELSSVGPLTALAELGQQVFAACSKTVFQFHAATRAQQDILCGHQALVTALCVHREALYSASRDRTVRGWKAGKNGVYAPTCCLQGHRLPVLAVCAAGDYLWTAAEDATLQVWDPAPAPSMSVFFFASSGGGVEPPRLVDSYKPHSNAVVALASRPSSSAEHSDVWTASWDGHMCVFRTRNALRDEGLPPGFDVSGGFDFLDLEITESPSRSKKKSSSSSTSSVVSSSAPSSSSLTHSKLESSLGRAGSSSSLGSSKSGKSDKSGTKSSSSKSKSKSGGSKKSSSGSKSGSKSSSTSKSKSKSSSSSLRGSGSSSTRLKKTDSSDMAGSESPTKNGRGARKKTSGSSSQPPE